LLDVFRDTARADRQGMNPPTLHVEELLSALARKGIPLPFEMGAFLVLQATEQIQARRPGDPIAKVAPRTVWLNDDGEVMLGEPATTRDESLACKALVELLGALLVRSAPGVPTMLLELVEQGPSDGAWTLGRLRDDLEAALLPLNRSATRRVLARLLREIRRDGERGTRGPVPDVRAVDRDVDALFGVAPTAESAENDDEDDDDELDVEVDERPPAKPARARARGDAQDAREPQPRGPRAADPRSQQPRERAAPAAGGVRRGLPARDEGIDPDTLSGGPSPAATLDDFEREVDDGQSNVGVRVGIAFVIAAALLVVAYFVFARGAG
jgi:hypothetical protein